MFSQRLPSGLRSTRCSQDQVLVDGLAVRGQPHQLVFAAVDLEAAVVGEGRIEQAQRVREPQLVRQPDRCRRRCRTRRGAPLADAVEGEDRRLLERAGEEGAGGVALVVVEEDQRRLSSPRAPGEWSRRMNSFFFSQTGMAMRKLRKPAGAYAR